MQSIQCLKSYEAARQPKKLTFRAALASIFAAPARVHHYRDVQTGMMREVFSELDCEYARRKGCHE